MAGENYNPKELAQVFYNEYRDRVGEHAPDAWAKLPPNHIEALTGAAMAMAMAYTIQVYGSAKPGMFEVFGSAGMSGNPLITVRAPSTDFRLTVEQALKIADDLQGAVYAAMNEAFLVEWATQELKMRQQDAARLIQKYRQFRQKIEAMVEATMDEPIEDTGPSIWTNGRTPNKG